MIINLVETELFGEIIKLYTFDTDDKGDVITSIYLNEKPLDIKNPEDILKTINFLKECYVDTTMPEVTWVSSFLNSVIKNDSEKLIIEANKKLDTVIAILETMYKNITVVKTEAPTAVENNALNIARHYMDEVIDPKGIMDAVEYNKLLSMFAMYSEWVLNR